MKDGKGHKKVDQHEDLTALIRWLGQPLTSLLILLCHRDEANILLYHLSAGLGLASSPHFVDILH